MASIDQSLEYSIQRVQIYENEKFKASNDRVHFMRGEMGVRGKEIASSREMRSD